jgi:hypothetical protein
MQSRRHFLTAISGAAALAAPALLLADDHDHNRDRAERYYDPDAKQWHEWNEAQEKAYRRWWAEQHHDQEFRDFRRLNDRDRRTYWRWWHEHEEHEEHERH